MDPPPPEEPPPPENPPPKPDPEESDDDAPITIDEIDVNKNIIGSKVNNKMIYHIDEIANFVSGKNIRFGIITTPASEAQKTADILISCGIQAIWNFTPSHLEIPKDIIVRNENLATSFAILAQKLQEKLMEDSNGKK